MKTKIGFLALAVFVGLGLEQGALGQAPRAGSTSASASNTQGCNCPCMRAAQGTTTGAATMGYGPYRGMRRNVAFAPGTAPWCPFNPKNVAVAGNSAGTSAITPPYGPGMGMRLNAPVAPGTGPFCPFNPNNSATTGNAPGTTKPGSANPQPSTK
jgi:hypothetical protein